MRLLLI